MSAKIRNALGIVVRLVLFLGLIVAGSGRAIADPNIVLILVDDMDWTDLPFFNRPVEWDDPYAPPGFSDTEAREAQIRAPAVNRVWARLYADADSSDPTKGLVGEYHDATSPFSVFPADISTYASGSTWDHRYAAGSLRGGVGCNSVYAEGDPIPANRITDKNKTIYSQNCDPATDILNGFGGLNRLATEGVVFERFYAQSARCSPARAALLTGRHIQRVGVVDAGDELEKHETTIAQLLKRKCSSGGSPCYTTGLVGKWHLGNRLHRHPWNKGFDEYIGFRGGSTKYWSDRDLTCSPTSVGYCVDSDVENPYECSNNGECDLGTCSGGSCSGDSSVACTLDPDCDLGECSEPGHFCTDSSPAEPCALLPGTPPDTCDSGTCEPGGLYVGKKNIAGCSEGDADTNEFCCDYSGGDDPRGRYRFKKKTGVGFAKDKSKTAWPCNDDGETTTTGCRYMTRFLRDQAVNFIVRHSDDANPFFLVLSFHAIHNNHDAPGRTRAHYKKTIERMKPKQPAKGEKYWAIVEEVDAAVGEVLKVLDGVCGPESANVGESCTAATADMDCGQGKPCHELADDTVVIFTSDHGRPGSGYGSPVIRAGKKSVYEGGIRVPTLIKWPDPNIDEGQIIRNELAGHVDLFATIADAANIDLSPGTMKVCEDPNDEETDVPCENNTDCTKALGANAECAVTRWIDGVSLKETMEGSSSDPARHFLFSRYKGDGDTIVSHPGYYEGKGGNFAKASHVCAYIGDTPDVLQRDCTAGFVGKPCSADGDCTAKQCSAPVENVDRFCTEQVDCEDWECTTGKVGEPCVDDVDCDVQGGDGTCTRVSGSGVCDVSTAGICGAQQCTAPSEHGGNSCDHHQECDTWTCTAPASKVGTSCTQAKTDASCDDLGGDGVCEPNGDGVCSGKLVRTVRGASCVPCGLDANNQGNCDAQKCYVLGKICYDPSLDPPDPCVDDDLLTACSEQNMNLRTRCRSDADCKGQTHTKCAPAGAIECNRCVSASWKLRVVIDDDPPIDPIVIDALYDLTSNPEEADRLDDGGVALLDCQTGDEPITSVEADLKNRLSWWHDCSADDLCSDEECEDQSLPPPDPHDPPAPPTCQ